ncbi:uncharacterized protein LOC132612882 [Lycium barbarum]|uniref:uncharacterized protein LOC132612882 n=1 Tax=Lycium barbarum TaxID=112863 RepID=UPI00293F2682|nr:uncharacterized protein LOC132612882 [Lycium barbarum]
MDHGKDQTATVTDNTDGVLAAQTSPVVVPIVSPHNFAKYFPDVSKVEVVGGQNFKRWQEHIFSALDMYGVASALTDSKPDESSSSTQQNQWVYANKVCKDTILSTLSNELFDVYCSNKKAKEIWDSLHAKYTAEDATKQKFVIGNFYKWEMTEDKDVKMQINEFHKLVEDLKSEKIILPEQFVAGMLIEKLPQSWSDYKQNLKHKQKQLSLDDLVKHIIIEDTNRKQSVFAKGKEITTNANLVEVKKSRNKNTRYEKEPGYNLKANNQTFKKKDDIIVAVISQVNIVASVNDRVIDSGATRHICANKTDFVSCTQVNEGEEVVYLGDSRTAQVLGKGKVLLKLTSGKTLALTEVQSENTST